MAEMSRSEFILKYRELALSGKKREEIAVALDMHPTSLSVKVTNLRKQLASKKGQAEAERLLPKLRGGAKKMDIDELFNDVTAKLDELDKQQSETVDESETVDVE